MMTTTIIPPIPNYILLNSIGIILEIAGFIILLIAVKAQLPNGGSFTSKYDKVLNVMSTVHPRAYVGGIIMVIVGLGCQLGSQILK